MKKIFAVLLMCILMVGCTGRTPEQKQDALPHIPTEIYAVKEITPASMEQLQAEVAALTIKDFLHADRIAMFEKRGFAVSIEKTKVVDCNSITFEIVLENAGGKVLRLPATGLLMYQYLPMNESYIGGLEVAWGNLALYDDYIVMANIDTMTLWSADSMQQIFRQPGLISAEADEFFFILDVVKNKDGYLLPYFSSRCSGFMTVSVSGNIVDIPLHKADKNNSIFGAYNLMESRNFNTLCRVETMVNCFYGDETEKQLFICRTQDYEYSGNRYLMYDFENGVFTESYQMASYEMPEYDFDIYSMSFYENDERVTKDTTVIAEKKENGIIVDKVVFKADIDGFAFGTDLKTGWNTYTHINMSEDMDVINYGCSKTDIVMTIDFAADTAYITKTADMPQMYGVDNSPNSMHMLYRWQNKQDTSLVARILSGNCRMDYITDVSGRWGIDWLAGFYNYDYIYVLTEDVFKLYRWGGTNQWDTSVYISGDFTVNIDKVNELCSIYVY